MRPSSVAFAFVSTCLLSAAIGVAAEGIGSPSGRTVPSPPPAVPDLNFNKDPNERVWARGKRTTVDGRVAVEVNLTQVTFKAFVPEDLVDRTQPLILGTGDLLAGGPRKSTVETSEFHESTLSSLKLVSVALCDANADTLIGRRYLSSANQNPVRCGEGPNRDCYDVTVVLVLGEANPFNFEIWSTPVRVELSRPKTPAVDGMLAAAVESVEVVGSPQESPVSISTPAYPGDFMETPTVSADGRVLFLNGGQGGLLYSVWSDPTGEEASQLAICDARGWTQFHRLSHAYVDPAMDDYGLGDHQILDTKGRLVADGEPIRGSYPWLDRSASNVVFSHVQAVNPTADEGGYEISMPDSDTCLDTAYVLGATLPKNDQAGLSTVGLWSRGKIVHLDGRANLSSYVISFNRLDKDIKADCPLPSEACSAVVGCANRTDALAAAANVRENGLLFNVWDDGSPVRVPINEARNTQLFSNENHFNYLPYHTPMTPRDVTWILNTSRNSMELAFDDLFAPDVLLEVSMVPPVSWELDPESIPYFNDGFVLDGDRNVVGYGTPWVQNAATARTETGFPSGLRPASHGVLEGGARIEPIAAGGFEGRGVFLDGEDDRIRFNFQPAGTTLASDVYVGLWLNPREFSQDSTKINREILHFPDGTILQLKGDDRIRFKKPGTPGADIFLLPGSIRLREDQWIHLAVQATSHDPLGETDITVYVNGYPGWIGTLSHEVFRLEAGDLIVGFDPERPTTKGYKGWTDEIHVVARKVSFEEACQQANGTIVAVDPGNGAHSTAISSQYDSYVHEAVAASAPDLDPRLQFYCEVHYPEDDALFRASGAPRPFFGGDQPQVCIDDIDRSTNERCVGKDLLFSEGPLFWNRPRPVSSSNAFCASCHTAADVGGRHTVDPSQVLVARPEWAVDDPRRQPLQPAPIVFGVLPHRYHGHDNANPDGDVHPVDPLVLEEYEE